MADASGHNKQMEDFMGSEVSMLRIKEWKFQGVNNAAYGVNDATCQKPAESRNRKRMEQLTEHEHTYPAHGYINNGGKYARQTKTY